MKYPAVITLALLLIACQTQTVKTHGGLVYRLELRNPELIDPSVDILTKRISRLCESNPKVIRDSNQIRIELPTETDPDLYTPLLTATGTFRIYETYPNPQLAPAISALLQKEKVWFEQFENEISPDDRRIDEILRPMIDDIGIAHNTAFIAKALRRDTFLINQVLKKNSIKYIFPSDAKFMWGRSPEPGYLALYAIRAPENYIPIDNSMIKNAHREYNYVLGESFVAISLKKEYHKHWHEMTKKNVGRALAMVVENHVYSAPRVMESIQDGMLQLNGYQLSEKEASLLAAILANEELQARPKVLSYELITVKK